MVALLNQLKVLHPVYVKIRNGIQRHKIKFMMILLLGLSLMVYFKPADFLNVWLTKDQQGILYFKIGSYDKAAHHFSSVRWKAYSLYAAEKFDIAAKLYNQFDGISEQLARANALSQARRYVKARNVYQNILSKMPEHPVALHNIKIVQSIIDDVDRMSESQMAEENESSKELGDDAQTGEGSERVDTKQQEIKQLTAQELMADPELSKMWLSQVQKNPARFLSIKFHMQQEHREQEPNSREGNSRAGTNERMNIKSSQDINDD